MNPKKKPTAEGTARALQSRVTVRRKAAEKVKIKGGASEIAEANEMADPKEANRMSSI
jgi:hypothetical protein